MSELCWRRNRRVALSACQQGRKGRRATVNRDMIWSLKSQVGSETRAQPHSTSRQTPLWDLFEAVWRHSRGTGSSPAASAWPPPEPRGTARAPPGGAGCGRRAHGSVPGRFGAVLCSSGSKSSYTSKTLAPVSRPHGSRMVLLLFFLATIVARAREAMG